MSIKGKASANWPDCLWDVREPGLLAALASQGRRVGWKEVLNHDNVGKEAQLSASHVFVKRETMASTALDSAPSVVMPAPPRPPLPPEALCSPLPPTFPSVVRACVCHRSSPCGGGHGKTPGIIRTDG